MKRLLPFAVLAVLLFGAIYLWGRDNSSSPFTSLVASHDRSVSRVINLDDALSISVPKPAVALKPVAFVTPDGRPGWVLRLPNGAGFSTGMPLPTPAYDAGKLFVGGGFDASQFYAIDAATGDVIWQSPTSDNGPTSASVDHGNIAFNTQSCSIMVMDENNGQTQWKEWLGDPLVSQPTVSNGKVYASFPSSAATESSMAFTPPSSLALVQGASPVETTTRVNSSGAGYKLLCANVKHGRHLWESNLPSEVISAPVVSGNRIYLACVAGSVFCLNSANGHTIWSRRLRATSAPVLANGRVALTVRIDRGNQPYEGIVRLDAATGHVLDSAPLVLSKATYLVNGGGFAGLDPAARRALDSAAGFPSGLPTTFQVGDAGPSYDMESVVGDWAYQGSRVAIAGNRILDAQGVYVNAVRETDGHVLWREQAVGKGIGPDTMVFSPPALGKRDLYLASAAGDIVALSQSSGQLDYAYNLGQPIGAQPVLAGGNIYVATVNGLLICIKTGSQDASGWSAWGGNAQHNNAH